MIAKPEIDKKERVFDHGSAGAFQLSEMALDAIIAAGRAKRLKHKFGAETQNYARELLQCVFNLSAISMFDEKIGTRDLAQLERAVNTLVNTKSPSATLNRFEKLRTKLRALAHLSHRPPNPEVFDAVRLRKWIAEMKPDKPRRGRPSDVAPDQPSFITGLCSPCGPIWTGLQTGSV